MKLKPSYVDFDHSSYPWKSDVDYRKNPHLYKIGRGQQGVLTCEPYKSEILPLWKFKTPEIAAKSSMAIMSKFLQFLSEDDFVGADMAKKFLHMGYTRSRRYANHKSGTKWKCEGEEWHILPDSVDPVKAECALYFYGFWKLARENKKYLKLKQEHRSKYG